MKTNFSNSSPSKLTGLFSQFIRYDIVIKTVIQSNMSFLTANGAHTYPVISTSVQDLNEFTTNHIKISNWAQCGALKSFNVWI